MHIRIDRMKKKRYIGRNSRQNPLKTNGFQYLEKPPKPPGNHRRLPTPSAFCTHAIVENEDHERARRTPLTTAQYRLTQRCGPGWWEVGSSSSSSSTSASGNCRRSQWDVRFWWFRRLHFFMVDSCVKKKYNVYHISSFTIEISLHEWSYMNGTMIFRIDLFIMVNVLVNWTCLYHQTYEINDLYDKHHRRNRQWFNIIAAFEWQSKCLNGELRLLSICN